MLVSYVRGNFSYGFSSGAWDLNEVKECEIASRTSLPPDDKMDVLLCGTDTRQAWKLSWIRSDLRRVIYDHARSLAVTFHSAGESRGKKETIWKCKRIPEGIYCE
jgi:hypothetical protein